MRTRVNGILCLILIGLIMTMAVLSYKAGEKGLGNVLLIRPRRPAETSVDIEKLEGRNAQDYTVSYETSKTAEVSVLNNTERMIVKGTNYLYAAVMNRPMLGGAFFSKAAQEGERKLAVLNAKAAFEIFGDMDISGNEVKIDGEIYTVCGVIQDGDKKNNTVYVPYLPQQGFASPDAFAAAIDGNMKTAKEEIVNRMKDFAVNDTVYDFYSLGDFVKAIRTKTLFSLKSAGFVLLLFLLISWFGRIRRKLNYILSLYEHEELSGLWRRQKKEMLSIAGIGLGMIIGAAVMLGLFLSGIEDLLYIAGAEAEIAMGYSAGFSHIINAVNSLSLYTFIAFLGFVVSLTVVFILNILSRADVSPPARQYNRQGGKTK